MRTMNIRALTLGVLLAAAGIASSCVTKQVTTYSAPTGQAKLFIYPRAEWTRVPSPASVGYSQAGLDSVRALPFIDELTFPLPTTEPHVRDITVDPKNPDVLYVALQLGYILKSTDCGRTWTLLDKNLDCDVHVILIDPVTPHRIAVATGGHDSRAGKAPGRAMYFSEDAGASWTPTAMDFTQDESVPLIRDPHAPQRMSGTE